MGTTKLEYTFKNDTLFKLLFVKYPDLLKRLVDKLGGDRHSGLLFHTSPLHRDNHSSGRSS